VARSSASGAEIVARALKDDSTGSAGATDGVTVGLVDETAAPFAEGTGDAAVDATAMAELEGFVVGAVVDPHAAKVNAATRSQADVPSPLTL